MPDAIGTIARLLDRARIAYVLIGGHAVNAWLEPRFTADVDVTVQADPQALDRARRELLREGFVVAAEHGAELPSGPDFLRFELPGASVRLEIQTAKTDLQREAIRRAIVRDGIRIATPEDLIVMKLIADRPKDRIDALGLARLTGLDWSYVGRWAGLWGISDRLRALRDT